MIFDKIENFGKYSELHHRFPAVEKFLKETDLRSLENGRIEVDGDNLFVLTSNNPAKTKDQAKLEVHRKYIDVQILLGEKEFIGWKELKDCSLINTEYNPEKDIAFFDDLPLTYLEFASGHFAIFFPQDAHAPMVGSGSVHKIVIKIKI